MKIRSLLLFVTCLFATPALAELPPFQSGDLFQMQWAADPQVSPDGRRIVYVRNHSDVMADRYRQNLWIIDRDGDNHQALTTGSENHGSPRWSPDGTRIAYVGNQDGSNQLYIRWMDTGREARVAQLTGSPSGIAWSPDGTQIAFSMFVPAQRGPFVQMPAAPRGAQWAQRAHMTEDLVYRRDGSGYIQPGNSHIFVVPADGGAVRQVTSGDYNHGGGVSWTADGSALIFAANRRDDAEYEPRRARIWRVDLASGEMTALTDESGPSFGAEVSPNGRQIAFVGFIDEEMSYQQNELFVMDIDGSNRRRLAEGFDRSLANVQWAANGRSIYVQFEEHGSIKVARVDLQGRVTELFDGLGGTSFGRPYGGGSFHAGGDGTIAFTQASTQRPAELAVFAGRGNPRTLTDLNGNLLGQRELATVEEIWYESSADGRRIQGWIMKPPGFDPEQQYPLILEIHGGPHTAYGEFFTVELQLYAAAGYVVLYTNPRGSTGYGQEFAQLIHHNYPGEDHDDLMSGIDAVIAQGYIDPERLYITGGSGGGVLSAWAIGMTDRFRAAVVQKPVINWYNFITDISVSATRYWFGDMPWENPAEYLRRSPYSLVGNVTTPTMLIVGDADYRTPASESEQYYQALRLNRVPAALVRIPGAPHFIGHRPSNMIEKALHVIGWFDRYNSDEEGKD